MNQVRVQSNRPTAAGAAVPALLGGVAAAVALTFAPDAIDAFATPKLAALSLGTLLVAVLAGGWRTTSLGGALRIVACYACVVGSAVAVGGGFSQALGSPFFRHGVVSMSCVIVLAHVAAGSQPYGRALSRTLWPIQASAVVLTVYAWIQFAGADPYSWSIANAPIATLGNQNSLACFVLMIGSYELSRDKLGAGACWSRAGLVAACFSVAALSGSRMALLVAIVACLITVTTSLGARYLVAAAVAGLAIGLLASGGRSAVRVLPAGDDGALGVSFSDRARLEIWFTSFGLVPDSIWSGLGPIGFRDRFAVERNPATGTLSELSDFGARPLVVNDPHSFPLELVLFYGLVPTVVAAGGVVYVDRKRGLPWRLANNRPLLLGLLPLVAFASVNPVGLAELTLAGLFMGFLFAKP